MTPADRAYLAIGRAVVTLQVFETVFAVLVEMFKMAEDEKYLEQSRGLLPPELFRTPTKRLVKELRRRDAISDVLEGELNALIEDRHVLIHRWHHENGVGDAADADYWRRYEGLAVRAESDARRIYQQLVGYVLKHDNTPEFRDRMKRLFRATGQPDV
jgi:hypothetical protein